MNNEEMQAEITRRLSENGETCWLTTSKYNESADMYKLYRKGNLFIFEQALGFDEFKYVTSATRLDILLEHIIGKYI